MNSKLPKFQKRSKAIVQQLVNDAIGAAHVVDLLSYPDGHFRVLFKDGYFKLAEGADTPSKSQWGTLKKRFKRRDRQMFIYKDSGKISSTSTDEACYYLDFGFFLYED